MGGGGVGGGGLRGQEKVDVWVRGRWVSELEGGYVCLKKGKIGSSNLYIIQ